MEISIFLGIHKIYQIIKECGHGIHDISIAIEDPNTGLARFNMPYELGLFIGGKHFGDSKRLILDKDEQRYDKFFSDIGGQDIRTHANSRDKASLNIRNYLGKKLNSGQIPSASIVWKRYLKYKKDAPKIAWK